ncbi:MFS transporter [Thermococcus thioreducens]|uniref:MFS transporter permease n=1 Tax=Thermococcus thioreducens TaxID=277988 RepID=A0A0Q2S4K7_9EURY|nr:MFS transporter [Thermococcus thioreducens]ASJ12610.1 MFS transporter permease [Thermococcus thioreducens]KQH82395.1 MFS transporter permease [Thermococcus thioreducens]SEV87933.1 Predicted arabinose efflux permease, MFS family [Thermococcus thioreducens]
MDWLDRFRLLFVLTYAGFLGNIAVIYYLSRGLSYGEIGIATAVSGLGFFLFEVPTGVVGDKVSRKTSVLIGLSIIPLATFLLLFLRSFWVLMVSQLLGTLGASFVSGSFQAWLFDNLRAENREGEFKEIWRSAQKLSLVVASTTTILGGFMAQFLGFEMAILLTVFLQVVQVPLALGIPEMGFSRPEHPYTVHVLGAWQELRKPEIAWLITYLLSVTLALNQFRKFFEPYLGNVLAVYLGMSIMGTLGILGIVEVLIRTVPRYLGVALKGRAGKAFHEAAPLGVPLATVLSVLYPNPVFIVLLGVLATLSASAFTFNVSVEFQRRVPSEKRATILSLRNMVMALITSIFYVVYGFMTDFLGLSRARLVFGVGFLLLGAVFKLASLGPLREPLELRHLAD